MSWLDKGTIRDVLKNWPLAQESRICVVTDGSRILGMRHSYALLGFSERAPSLALFPVT